MRPRRFVLATVLLGLGTMVAAYFVQRTVVGEREIEREATTALAAGALQARLLDSDWWARELQGELDGAEFEVTAHPPGKGVWFDERRDGQHVARHAVLMELVEGRTRVRWIRRKTDEGAHLPQGELEEQRLDRFLKALTGPSGALSGNP